jgi:hypothetical protein
MNNHLGETITNELWTYPWVKTPGGEQVRGWPELFNRGTRADIADIELIEGMTVTHGFWGSIGNLTWDQLKEDADGVSR